MTDASPHRRVRISGVLKLLCGAALVTGLVWQAAGSECWIRLRSEPLGWPYLALGLGMTVGANLASWVRWWIVSHAGGAPLRLAETIRWGSVGFALNFFAFGNVGGDVFKMVAAARRYPTRRAAAVATIVVDRLYGLLGLLAFASVAAGFALASGVELSGPIRVACQFVLVSMVVATLAVVFAATMPGVAAKWAVAIARRWPRIGHSLVHGVAIWREFHGQPGKMALAIVPAIVTDIFIVLSIYFIGRGLPVTAPPLAQQAYLTPIALFAEAVPISPGGLGVLEAAMNELYQWAVDAPPGDGAFVAVTHRLSKLLIASLWMVGYFVWRRTEGETSRQDAQDAKGGRLTG